MLTNELDFLYQVQSSDAFCPILLPGYNNEKGYYINLETRAVESPKVLSVQKDHNSNIVYFVVDRFYDYMDLSTTACVIQYITPDGETHIYAVPYYDVYSRAKEQQMIIPWNVENLVTSIPGQIEYSFRFFKIRDNGTSRELIYNLSTSSAVAEILTGIDIAIPSDAETEEDKTFHAQTYEDIVQYVKNNQIYWIKKD